MRTTDSIKKARLATNGIHLLEHALAAHHEMGELVSNHVLTCWKGHFTHSWVNPGSVRHHVAKLLLDAIFTEIHLVAYASLKTLSTVLCTHSVSNSINRISITPWL